MTRLKLVEITTPEFPYEIYCAKEIKPTKHFRCWWCDTKMVLFGRPVYERFNRKYCSLNCVRESIMWGGKLLGG